jgi:adenylate cyclase
MLRMVDKPKILYVDDETHNLEVFVATFRRNYTVLTASSAKEALDLLHHHTIAVIITDQRMPEMTGVDFLESIIPEYPDPIRMLLTGFSDMEAIIKAINNGKIFKYISKPWDANDLKQTIDIAVRMFQLAEKNRALIQQMQEETTQQERILSLFKKYVPEHVVQNTIDNQNNLFEGESRKICILFATIQKFNDVSNSHDPKEILNYLGHYYSLMAGCIKEHKGAVDKFMGGNIVAIFGAPVSYLENEENAVFCAIDMLEKLKLFNQKHSKDLNCEIAVGIGINSGEVVVGNMGSQQYISYTAIGDAVNTAARIMEVAKEFPNTILVGETVYQKIKQEVSSEPLGATFLRGKEAQLNLYKIKGRRV